MYIAAEVCEFHEMLLLIICHLGKKFSSLHVCCAFICIYVHSATGITLQYFNIHFREPVVPVNTTTMPSSDGEQSFEQWGESCLEHGDGGKPKKSVRLSIADGSVLNQDDEHSPP